MALVVDLPGDVERHVREEASRAGVDPSQFVREVLLAHLAVGPTAKDGVPRTEAELLERINVGLLPESWERFHALIARRQAETLTPEELAELRALTEDIEEGNSRRMGYLAELARLRGVSLPRLMDELGLQPPPYA